MTAQAVSADHYTWNWVASQKTQSLQKKLRSHPETILQHLAEDLLNRPAPGNGSFLASRILRYVPNSALSSYTGTAFFRSIQKMRLFCPQNAEARTQLFDLTVHAITSGKTLLAKKLISSSHCCDDELLFLACHHGIFAAARELIQQGANLECRDEAGNTPLHIAVMKQHGGLFELLVQEGADINAKNTLGKTPLHLAVEANNERLVQKCIGYEAEINIQDGEGNTPVFKAFKAYEDHVALALLQAGADPLIENQQGDSLEIYLGISMRLATAEIFKGFPWLHRFIATTNHFFNIKALVAGSLVQIMDGISPGSQDTPLEIAFIMEDAELAKTIAGSFRPDQVLKQVKFLYGKHPQHRDRLFCLACAAGFKRSVQWMIDQGMDVNLVRNNKRSPIHHAASEEQMGIMQLLLDHGANINAQDNRGNTPLHLAVYKRSEPLITLLLNNGCNAQMLNRDGDIPLQMLLEHSSLHGMIPIFVPQHCPVDIRDGRGNTPLMIACQHYHDAIDTLLDLGADPNASSPEGETPLHYVCEEGYNQLAIRLYQKGARVWQTNSLGETPLKLALESQMNPFIDHIFCNYGYIHHLMDKENGCEDFIERLCGHPERLMDSARIEEEAVPLEVPMMLRSEKLARMMIGMLTSSQFEREIARLEQRYPAQAVHFIKDCLYLQNSAHLLKGAAHLVDIPEPPNIKLSILKVMFGEINFTDPKQPGYQNPEKLTDDGSPISARKVEKGLTKLLDRIRYQTPYTGTPRAGSPQLKVFYRNLERLMKHIAKGLKESDDAMMKTNSLIDIGIAGKHCGIRWISQAHQSYQMLFNGCIPLTFEERILELLRSYRTNVLLNIIADSDVHTYNQVLALAGKELGIAGASALTGYEDVYADETMTREEILETFYALYTSHAIIEFVVEEMGRLYKELETQDLVVDWFKDHIPQDWQQETYEELKRGVQRLAKKQKSDADIRRYLLKHQVYCPEGGDPLKAIEDERKANYLTEEVFEQDSEGQPTANFRRKAIIHMLMRLDIFQQIEFRKEEPASGRHVKRRRRGNEEDQ